jgi:hypothetical protein
VHHKKGYSITSSSAKPTSKHLNMKTEKPNLWDPDETSKQTLVFAKFFT